MVKPSFLGSVSVMSGDNPLPLNTSAARWPVERLNIISTSGTFTFSLIAFASSSVSDIRPALRSVTAPFSTVAKFTRNAMSPPFTSMPTPAARVILIRVIAQYRQVRRIGPRPDARADRIHDAVNAAVCQPVQVGLAGDGQRRLAADGPVRGAIQDDEKDLVCHVRHKNHIYIYSQHIKIVSPTTEMNLMINVYAVVRPVGWIRRVRLR